MVSGRMIRTVLAGSLFAASGAQAAWIEAHSKHFVVLGNEVKHFKTPIEFNSAAVRLFQATNGKVERNVVYDVQVGHGIALDSGSTGNLIKGNLIHHTARDGLMVEAGSTSNTLEENVSFLNGEFDAEDGNRTSNLWCRTWCLTDDPPGTICMQTDPGCP